MATDRRSERTGPVRCAIYTRKSTTEGLDSGFSTLDAQREACEHYIRSQAAQGWELLPDAYDDGGFTGGNLDRPGLTRLLKDIEAERVDMVVVYKIDRLSRSLADFTRLVEQFERKHVGFVSITQHFDTSNSMGRLTLNMLLSFAQFERELISERTRDKIQAARRRGKWTGGKVVLGYAIDKERRRLVIVPDEAKLVRLVFELYLQTRSIVEVARKLNGLGQTQKGGGKDRVRGRAWDKNSVQRVLRNPLYVGKTRAKDGSLHLGEHDPIVTADVFDRAQASLDERTTGTTRRSRKAEYLLTGILRCGPCDAAMTSSFARGRSGRGYRYYRCCAEQSKGMRCPTGLLVTDEIEQVVVAQLRDIAGRGELRKRVLVRVGTERSRRAEIEEARERIDERLAALTAEAKRLIAAFGDTANGGRLMAERLGEIEVETDQLRRQRAELEARLAACESARFQSERVAALLDGFEQVWEALVPEERRELLHLVVNEIVVDLQRGGLRIDLHDLDEGAVATTAVA